MVYLTTEGEFTPDITYLNTSLTNSSVGMPQQKRSGRAYRYEDVDGKEDGDAFATFHFKYRSLSKSHPVNIMIFAQPPTDTLKSIGVVPRTPVPRRDVPYHLAWELLPHPLHKHLDSQLPHLPTSATKLV